MAGPQDARRQRPLAQLAPAGLQHRWPTAPLDRLDQQSAQPRRVGRDHAAEADADRFRVAVHKGRQLRRRVPVRPLERPVASHLVARRPVGGGRRHQGADGDQVQVRRDEPLVQEPADRRQAVGPAEAVEIRPQQPIAEPTEQGPQQRVGPRAEIG